MILLFPRNILKKMLYWTQYDTYLLTKLSVCYSQVYLQSICHKLSLLCSLFQLKILLILFFSYILSKRGILNIWNSKEKRNIDKNKPKEIFTLMMMKKKVSFKMQNVRYVQMVTILMTTLSYFVVCATLVFIRDVLV
jgi:hypothetical protein